MKISFNLRVGYTHALDCIKKIEELGGEGYITVGGSYYIGTEEQIDELIAYMGEKDYDLASMSINKSPREATQERVDSLKEQNNNHGHR